MQTKLINQFHTLLLLTLARTRVYMLGIVCSLAKHTSTHTRTHTHIHHFYVSLNCSTPHKPFVGEEYITSKSEQRLRGKKTENEEREQGFYTPSIQNDDDTMNKQLVFNFSAYKLIVYISGEKNSSHQKKREETFQAVAQVSSVTVHPVPTPVVEWTVDTLLFILSYFIFLSFEVS